MNLSLQSLSRGAAMIDVQDRLVAQQDKPYKLLRRNIDIWSAYSFVLWA
jgi:hypothetical protein